MPQQGLRSAGTHSSALGLRHGQTKTQDAEAKTGKPPIVAILVDTSRLGATTYSGHSQLGNEALGDANSPDATAVGETETALGTEFVRLDMRAFNQEPKHSRAGFQVVVY